SRSSDFPGEAANALAAARRIAAEAGFDLDTLMSGTRQEAEDKLYDREDQGHEPFGWHGWHPARAAKQPYVQYTTVMYAAEQAAKLARDRERMAAEARQRATERPAKPTPASVKKKGSPMPDLSMPIMQRYRQRMDRIRRR
ncbi:MAG: hypothetical protein AAGC83_04940, partial [Pseudomonadota bacterium]